MGVLNENRKCEVQWRRRYDPKYFLPGLSLTRMRA